MLCTLTVDDHTSKDGTKRYMLGREPVLSKKGEPLVDAQGRRSYVTSAGAGPSIGKHILMSYLPPENANVGEELLVEYLGEQYPVTVATNDSTPVFDPGERAGQVVRILVARQARPDHRREDGADRRRAGDPDAAPRLHDLAARGVRRRGGRADRRGARRRGRRAHARPGGGGGAAARVHGARRRPRDPPRRPTRSGTRRRRRRRSSTRSGREEPLRPDRLRQRVGGRGQLPGRDPGRVRARPAGRHRREGHHARRRPRALRAGGRDRARRLRRRRCPRS